LLQFVEDGSILRRSLVDNQELTVQESSSSILTNKRKNIRKKLNVDEKQKLLELEEQLIFEVHAREPLWNPQIELSLRSRKATAQLWKEVSEALDGKQSVYLIDNKIFIIITRTVCNS